LLFKNRNSLASRLTFQVIVLSSLVTVLSTALQLYLDYRQDVRSIYLFFDSIKETSLRPLEESVWILDDLQVNLQLEGLIKRQDIVYAAVEMDQRITWSKGMPVRQDNITQSFPLVHPVRNGFEEIGTLHVMASLEAIYHRLLRRITILLASNAVKTFLVAGFILLLFKKNITDHLERMADHVQQIDIQQQEPQPLRLNRTNPRTSDELDLVSEALNGLCQGGYQAYRDLRIQEQRLRLLFDATEEAIFGVDPQGRCTFINRVANDILSSTKGQSLLGRDLLAMLASHDQPPSSSLLGRQVQTTIEERRVLFTDELPLVLSDGLIMLISLRSYPVVEQQRCTGAVVFFADISRQQKLEQEKQLFTRIIRQAPALILVVNADGVIEYVNSIFEQIFGFEAQTLAGTLAQDSFKSLDITPQMGRVRNKIANGETWVGTFTGKTMDGRKIVLDATVFPIFDRRGQLTNIVAMGRDITREQQLTEQLHHIQKMEAIGKLAASIAHEFGNPLLGIRFALRDVQQRAQLEQDDAHLLQLAESECDRMRKLIRDLQQFNRPSSGRKVEFDPHRILEEIMALHHNLLTKKKITVIRDYEPRPIRLHAVEDQMRQVLINLILNATDAMETAGGTLTLRTRLAGGEVVICVEDSGGGIAEEHLQRIFEPFFTTKAAVEGTGLGLAVSYGIVRGHGGDITVQSRPGQTVFTVTLPARAMPAATGVAPLVGATSAARVETSMR